MKAIALEKPDRTPVILSADSFCARHMGIKLSAFIADVKLSNEVMLKSIQALGEVDGANKSYAYASILPLLFFLNVKLPGRELPDNLLWQIDEKELITVQDYDTIINRGYEAFYSDFIKKRLNYSSEAVNEILAYVPEANKRFNDAGYMVYSSTFIGTVSELLSGGRSLTRFMTDLYQIPDKVEAVLQIMQEDFLEKLRRRIRKTKETIVFISPAHGASEFFAPRLWERFIWKYLKETVDVIIEEGAVASLHIDANWERDLDYFRSFPKGKCVFESDGTTNIYKIKEKLGDIMCIKGDVPSNMFVFSNEDEVYHYCTTLIKEIGAGLILSSGCSLPPDARIENVKAMISAATGK